MVSQKLVFAVMVIVCSLKVVGCRGEAAPSNRPPHPQAAANSAFPRKNASQASLAGKRARQLHSDSPHRDTPREAFLSIYNNPQQGISFRYPRNYSLEEGEVLEHSFFLKKQDDLDIDRPGSQLVATVSIPEDGYPNTTFEHGSLQLVVNESANEKACRDSLLAGASANASGTTTIQGVVFSWSEQETETGGTKILERTYTGYSGGTCYTFLLTVAAEEAPDPDGFKKPADTARIMKQLEKIISSAEIFNKSVPPPPEVSEETADRL